MPPRGPLSRAPRRPGNRRGSRLGQLIRWLLGISLLLVAVYVAVRIFADPAWATPAVIGFTGAMVVLALLGGGRRLRRRQTLSRLISGTPTEFEETVARMMRSQGFRDVRRTGGSGDLTADVVATDRAGRTVVVQCKRYQPGKAVGSKEIQTFIGMQRIHHQADYGLYATTSSYTRPARDLATQHGITLIDGVALTAALTGGQRPVWMRR